MEKPVLSGAPFRLGEWEVHSEDGTLRSAVATRRLEPQLMDLLVFLAARAGGVVSKQQILDAVWGGRIVSDDALTGSVSQLRKALGDDVRSPRYIETIPKRGYRLRATSAGGQAQTETLTSTGEMLAPARESHRRWRSAGIVAAAVILLAAALTLGLLRRRPEDSRTAPPPDALEAYRQGRALLVNPSEDSLEQARLDFTQALEADPRFAAAAAGLADVDLIAAALGAGNPVEIFPRARAAALRAVELDPDSAAGRTSLGTLYLLADRDFPRAEAELRLAIRLEPGAANARRIYALLLSALGRHGEAVAAARRAVALAPRDLWIRSSLAEVLLMARRYPELLRVEDQTLGLAPDSPGPQFRKGWAYAFLGRDREAWSSFRLGLRAFGVPAENLERLDGVFAQQGLQGVYRSIARGIEQVRAVRKGNWTEVAAFYGAAGERDRAFLLLERAAERGETGLVWLRTSPFADPVRSDPRFERLLRRLGFSPLPPPV